MKKTTDIAALFPLRSDNGLVFISFEQLSLWSKERLALKEGSNGKPFTSEERMMVLTMIIVTLRLYKYVEDDAKWPTAKEIDASLCQFFMTKYRRRLRSNADVSPTDYYWEAVLEFEKALKKVALIPNSTLLYVTLSHQEMSDLVMSLAD